MKLHAIIIFLSFPLTLLAQDKTGGFPYFLWEETYQNQDNFDKYNIETKLYTYSQTTNQLEVEEYAPFFLEPYDENTFYIKISRESKESKEKIINEYFRISDSQWRKITTDSSGTYLAEIKVLEEIALVDSVEYCHAIQAGDVIAFDSGLWLMEYKKIIETDKIKSKTIDE